MLDAVKNQMENISRIWWWVARWMLVCMEGLLLCFLGLRSEEHLCMEGLILCFVGLRSEEQDSQLLRVTKTQPFENWRGIAALQLD